MKFINEPLPGVRLLSLNNFKDLRGTFVKTYSSGRFTAENLNFCLKEEFYSFSKKNVIRGMHFQLPPYDHDKIVYCAVGAVLDVLLDLRSGAGQGKFCSLTLDETCPQLLFIPRGVAHGFKSLVDGSLMIYKTSSEYAPTHDAGIRWDSFGFDWGSDNHVLSERDAAHPELKHFKSPF